MLRLITSKAKDKEGEGVEPLCSLGKLSFTEFSFIIQFVKKSRHRQVGSSKFRGSIAGNKEYFKIFHLINSFKYSSSQLYYKVVLLALSLCHVVQSQKRG